MTRKRRCVLTETTKKRLLTQYKLKILTCFRRGKELVEGDKIVSMFARKKKKSKRYHKNCFEEMFI